MPSPDPDFAPTASWEMLRLRAALLWRVRQFFERRGFVEVETPLLSRDTVADLHLDPIPVMLFHDPRDPQQGEVMWLQTSPELAMKRLLAAGAQRIFQVTRAFRAGERGPRHNPEFTIVEWYQVGDSLAQGMQLLAEFAQELLAVPQVNYVSYEAAFRDGVGVNPHTATPSELAARAAALGLSPPESMRGERDEWLNFLLAECVEPGLGKEVPAILFDYPASQAALARVRTVDRPASDGGPAASYQVAERFELYYQGVELANGYHELLDPHVLQERMAAANAARQRDGRYPVPAHSRLIDAMVQGLPPCSGVALGFDRLVMVAAGKHQLREVMAFPIDRA